MTKDSLRILPLGGLGEIGMNCLVLEWKDDMVLLDCGIQFPDASYPGVELIVPDLQYVRERKNKLRGVVVTHGHDDHIGAIPYLAMEMDVDVYSTPFPQGLLHYKLLEFPYAGDVRFHDIKPRQKFKVGPFDFDPIPVQHSIIESVAFAIETPVGTLIHTGDFKHDPAEHGGETITFQPFEEYGKKGVHMLLSDSTNAERAGHTVSEHDIAESFEKIFAGQKGRILIALFASNIRRVEHLLAICKKQGKKVALAGRSMHSYTRLAHEQQSLEIPEDTLVLLENLGQYPDDSVVVLLTGSQAEPRSALVRIAEGTHRFFQVKPGDRVILSSRFIPGNERNITAMIDHLFRLGADVTYESIHQIHVSGHGFQEELMLMLEATRPKFFVPIHGEYRHLAKHAGLAKAVVSPENIFIVEDGDPLDVGKEAVQRSEKLELQKGVIVAGAFMAGSAELFQKRNALSKTGIVYVSLLVNRKNHRVTHAPQINIYGVLFRKSVEEDHVLEDLETVVEDAYNSCEPGDDTAEMIRRDVRRYFKKVASHKPVVIPVILEV